MKKMILIQDLEKYSPQLPLPELIVEINRLYHAFEANEYKQSHPEIYDQLPLLWRQMLVQVQSLSYKEPLHVLDFGCGTGFEADQLLKVVPLEMIGSLVCYDPSVEMLNHCRDKISSRFLDAVFCECFKDIPCKNKFTLLLTNSLLHHLPNPLITLMEIQQIISDNCFWCSGHEPSRKFYQNSDCIKLLSKYKRVRRMRQLLQPTDVYRYIRNRFGLTDNIKNKTAKESYKRGIFAIQPSEKIIAELVDYHVPHSSQEVANGRGFSVEEISANLKDRWELKWQKSYSFMGPFYEKKLPPRWKKKVAKLAEKYPNDGANFCTIWQRN